MRKRNCEHCGADLRKYRAPASRIEAPGHRLVEAVEAPNSDIELKGMGYRAVLRYSADDRGYLKRDRLVRVARARGYAPGWVYHNAGKHYEEVWRRALRWRQKKKGDPKA